MRQRLGEEGMTGKFKIARTRTGGSFEDAFVLTVQTDAFTASITVDADDFGRALADHNWDVDCKVSAESDDY